MEEHIGSLWTALFLIMLPDIRFLWSSWHIEMQGILLSYFSLCMSLSGHLCDGFYLSPNALLHSIERGVLSKIQCKIRLLPPSAQQYTLLVWRGWPPSGTHSQHCTITFHRRRVLIGIKCKIRSIAFIWFPFDLIERIKITRPKRALDAEGKPYFKYLEYFHYFKNFKY